MGVIGKLIGWAELRVYGWRVERALNRTSREVLRQRTEEMRRLVREARELGLTA